MKTSNPRSAKKPGIEKAKPSVCDARAGHWPRGDTAVSLTIFLLAFAIRLVYLFQIEGAPLFYHLASDGRSYDEWARQIAAGHWLGQGVFYQAPLYPYFLGLLQIALGHNLWSIRIVQIALGSASCVLLYWAGKLFFSRAAGVAAGLILSLYAPAIFFDGLIQKTVLDLFLITLLLFLLSRTQPRFHWSYWVGIGAVLGLLGLTRENALIWGPVVPLWIWLHFSADRPRNRLRWIVLFLLGLVLVLFPVGLRNLIVDGEFTLTTAQLGPNFFIGNNPEADGTYAPLRAGHGDPQFERRDATELAERALGRSLSPGEVSGYWLRRSWDYIGSRPIDWLRLLGKKWLIAWNVRELEDAEDFYLYQGWSWLLSILGYVNHFGVLAPLAAVGVMLTWGQWRKLWLLYGLLATLVFSVALFYVFGRYRFSMVPLLTLFAGVGLVEGFAVYRDRAVRRGLACVAALALTAAMVYLPVAGKAAPSATGYVNVSNALADQGRISEAIESLRQALLVRPTYGLAHYNLGNLLASQGKLDEAKYHFEEAIRINPGYAEAHNNLANVLAMQGELKEAIQHFRRALELGLAVGEIHYNLGIALVREGDLTEAAKHFQEAIEINPSYAEAYHNLGRIEATQGDLDRAMEHFRQALRIQPRFAEAHESLGHALAQRGNKEEAVQHYQEALRIMRARGKEMSPRELKNK
ncbi:MAG: tetratricopeptide repeat protein [Deltaproteobacteria bacterium]|nr:MAG: tetratricopeptide repeat protein [Deltaproteobacteria bacterium]